MDQQRTRDWRPAWPCSVGAALGAHKRGAGDPTYRRLGDQHWRGIRTPAGPVTLLVEPRSGEGVVRARAWGPGADLKLWVQPAPGTVRQVPSWEWLRMHVDPARSRALVTAARVADSLERTVGLPGDEVERRLTSLPGIGVWTAAEVRQRAHGDADAVSFGDYHVAKDVGWAVAGRAFDDAELAEFLEPWRPHRGRVVVLCLLAGGRPERRGPRMAPRTHLPATVTRRT